MAEQHWSTRPQRLIDRLDRVRVGEVTRGGKVVSYDPARELVVDRGGRRTRITIDEAAKVSRERIARD